MNLSVRMRVYWDVHHSPVLRWCAVATSWDGRWTLHITGRASRGEAESDLRRQLEAKRWREEREREEKQRAAHAA